MKKPNRMSDDVYQALLMMLDSPWYNWDRACGMSRPYWWQPWKLHDFKKLVDVTKMAIRSTLSREFYPSDIIPRVDIEKKNDVWSLDVTTWGRPLECKIS